MPTTVASVFNNGTETMDNGVLVESIHSVQNRIPRVHRDATSTR
jgi:hypothetical protein